MIKDIFKISCVAILVSAFSHFALAEDKSCCAIAGAGGFTLSEEDKAALQDNKETKESKSEETNDKSNKEKQ